MHGREVYKKQYFCLVVYYKRYILRCKEKVIMRNGEVYYRQYFYMHVFYNCFSLWSKTKVVTCSSKVHQNNYFSGMCILKKINYRMAK
jgi:hypothetical protein